ncbi:MAG: ParB N-terminal domain-containing protein, partial [Pseudomonadota bacterium]
MGRTCKSFATKTQNKGIEMLNGQMETYMDALIDLIEVGKDRRPINQETVDRLKESIEAIGLHTPITVHVFDEGCQMRLVSGHHRLKAYQELGRDEIPAFVINDDLLKAQMWEISENLHRAELTALERSEQIARWLELSKARTASQSGTQTEGDKLFQPETVSNVEAQNATVSQLATRDNESQSDAANKLSQVETVSLQVATKPQGGRPEGGNRAAARELGIETTDAHRATKVASLTDEAKEAAVEVGLDDNRSALLDAAKQPAEKQADHIRQT